MLYDRGAKGHSDIQYCDLNAIAFNFQAVRYSKTTKYLNDPKFHSNSGMSN